MGLDLYGCHEALERLDDYTDRELSPDETAKVEHLEAPAATNLDALKSRIAARLFAVSEIFRFIFQSGNNGEGASFRKQGSERSHRAKHHVRKLKFAS